MSIGGAVYNKGGAVNVSNAGDMLQITGADAAGHSYWQTQGTLLVNAGANLSAFGNYEIDAGLVTLTAPAGAAADELDGAGLIFGNAGATALNIEDATPGTPGTVTVQGPVTLSATTTTTMNFDGANNTADRLDVQNGALTLGGGLSLKGFNGQKPTQALTFFDDAGNAQSIIGTFNGVMDNVMGKDKIRILLGQNPELVQVTIQ